MDKNSLIKEWGPILDKYEPIKVLGVKRVDIKLFEGVIGTVKVFTKM